MTRPLDELRRMFETANAQAAHHALKRRPELAKLARARARACRRMIERRERNRLARPPPP